MEVPGIDPAELHVSVVDDVLTIEGEKRDDRESDGEGWRVTERRFGKVRRRVALPAAVDADKVSAETKNGVLSVRLPKSEADQPKVIPVSTAD